MGDVLKRMAIARGCAQRSFCPHQVRFQSTPNVWAYFSCPPTQGAIHEFADSQFGHIFAKGPDRDAARRALQLALKNIAVDGEIRPPAWQGGLAPEEHLHKVRDLPAPAAGA